MPETAQPAEKRISAMDEKANMAVYEANIAPELAGGYGKIECTAIGEPYYSGGCVCFADVAIPTPEAKADRRIRAVQRLFAAKRVT